MRLHRPFRQRVGIRGNPPDDCLFERVDVACARRQDEDTRCAHFDFEDRFRGLRRKSEQDSAGVEQIDLTRAYAPETFVGAFGNFRQGRDSEGIRVEPFFHGGIVVVHVDVITGLAAEHPRLTMADRDLQRGHTAGQPPIGPSKKPVLLL